MKTKIFLKSLIVLLLMNCCYSQNDTSIVQEITQAGDKGDDLSCWFMTGLGLNTRGFSAGINFSFDFGESIISIRHIQNEEFVLFGPSPSERAWDIGILYGIVGRRSYGLASISGGLSYVGGIHRGSELIRRGFLTSEYDSRTFYTIGLPVECQLFLTPFSCLGVGIYAFADINPESSFAGALLCLQFGNLK